MSRTSRSLRRRRHPQATHPRLRHPAHPPRGGWDRLGAPPLAATRAPPLGGGKFGS